MTPWPLEKPIPALLNDTELREVLSIGSAKFYELKRAGKFQMFEVSRPLGQRRYSGTKVKQYIDGESMAVMGGRR
jgi:hypothetical protein